ncbi:amino acid permease, putative, partial [Bodo saltans]
VFEMLEDSGVTLSGTRSEDEDDVVLDGTRAMQEDSRSHEVEEELHDQYELCTDCATNKKGLCQNGGDGLKTDVTMDMQHIISRRREEDEAVQLGNKIFKVVSGILSFLCLVTAVVAPGLDIVFGLLGGLCSSSLCFFFPAAYRLQLAKEMLRPIDKKWIRWVAWTMMVVGVLGAVFGTAASMTEFIGEE